MAEVYTCVLPLEPPYATSPTSHLPIMSMSQPLATADHDSPVPSPVPDLLSDAWEAIPGPSAFHPSHASIRHRIGFDATLSSPAPVSEGAASGYFNDDATRRLLGLEDDDSLLHSGTYGDREPGGSPVELSFLLEGTYDQRLMPFIPRHYVSFLSVDMHEANGQAYPYMGCVNSLSQLLLETLREAQELGQRVELNLPDYVRLILPRILFQRQEGDRPFARQLQPFFSPSATRARWARICRCIALLQGFVNLCNRLLHPTDEWRVGEPVGMRASLLITGGEAMALLRAYHSFQLPIQGPPPPSLLGYEALQARASLLDPIHRVSPLHLPLELISDLDPLNDDNLHFTALAPNYNRGAFDEDGV